MSLAIKYYVSITKRRIPTARSPQDAFLLHNCQACDPSPSLADISLCQENQMITRPKMFQPICNRQGCLSARGCKQVTAVDLAPLIVPSQWLKSNGDEPARLVERMQNANLAPLLMICVGESLMPARRLQTENLKMFARPFFFLTAKVFWHLLNEQSNLADLGRIASWRLPSTPPKMIVHQGCAMVACSDFAFD